MRDFWTWPCQIQDADATKHRFHPSNVSQNGPRKEQFAASRNPRGHASLGRRPMPPHRCKLKAVGPATPGLGCSPNRLQNLTDHSSPAACGCIPAGTGAVGLVLPNLGLNTHGFHFGLCASRGCGVSLAVQLSSFTPASSAVERLRPWRKPGVQRMLGHCHPVD